MAHFFHQIVCLSLTLYHNCPSFSQWHLWHHNAVSLSLVHCDSRIKARITKPVQLYSKWPLTYEGWPLSLGSSINISGACLEVSWSRSSNFNTSHTHTYPSSLNIYKEISHNHINPTKNTIAQKQHETSTFFLHAKRHHAKSLWFGSFQSRTPQRLE